jgi:hypothetical protein
MVAAGFKAGGLKASGPRAASFTAWCFGEASGFAEAARFGKVAGFGEATRFGDLSCFDEPLKTSDSQPAWLTSIDRSSDAAIVAMMVQWRGQTSKLAQANFFPNDSNPLLRRRNRRPADKTGRITEALHHHRSEILGLVGDAGAGAHSVAVLMF